MLIVSPSTLPHPRGPVQGSACLIQLKNSFSLDWAFCVQALARMIVKIVFWYNALNNYLLQCLSQRRCLVTGEVNAGGGGVTRHQSKHPIQGGLVSIFLVTCFVNRGLLIIASLAALLTWSYTDPILLAIHVYWLFFFFLFLFRYNSKICQGRDRSVVF